MEHRIFSTEIAGKPFSVEVGKFAPLTDSTVLASYCDTQIMVHVVSSEAREGIDFFPLSCEFQEKLYAVGKIPGGYLKREGRPSEKATLASRLMDRPIRPLFPDGYNNDVQIIAQVMSIDHSVSPEIVAILGASVALSIAKDIPFEGPIGAVHVGYKDSKVIFNPTEDEQLDSLLSLSLAGTKEAVMMVEAQANQLSEEVMLDAIKQGHEIIKEFVSFVEEVQRELNIEKSPFVKPQENEELKEKIAEIIKDDVYRIYDQVYDKEERAKELEAVNERLLSELNLSEEELQENQYLIQKTFKSIEKKTMRSLITNYDKRPDGRNSLEIRPITTEVGLIRRTHGSGYFVRGLTSALSLTTLGALGEAQRLDGIEAEENKRFMHHYNFPNFSVGETGPMRGPNRRAIGHGALGEKALLAVIPDEEDFPYTIRVVSEVLSSNGSTSQASICAASMSMMNAGVPIKAPVAGIAMGLIKEEDKVTILSDIQGVEDFLGDMDFKVAGTTNGITAIQMDMKISGIDEQTLTRALHQAKEGRMHILSKMSEAISEVGELSPYAPRVFTLQINPDKIRDVIGTGGKIITKITTDYNVKVDIDDLGKVIITAADSEGGLQAKKRIEDITREIEIGTVFDGKVSKVASFGAFVDIDGIHEVLVHISELSRERLKTVESKYKVGDPIRIKITEKDDDGKLKGSVKALEEDSFKKEKEELIKNIKVGDVFTAKIVKILKFGVFVELKPGIDGFVHISELTERHLRRVEDEFKLADEIVVKVTSIEDDKISASRKAIFGDSNESKNS